MFEWFIVWLVGRLNICLAGCLDIWLLVWLHTLLVGSLVELYVVCLHRYWMLVVCLMG